MRISDWSSDVCSSDLFANFSIGPYMPMDDDEVHPWTALIDKHLATGKTFATIAVGNDGDKAWPECRVQPPSDMVNAIAVGACDTTSDAWQRAPDRKSTRLNSSHKCAPRMPSSV